MIPSHFAFVVLNLNLNGKNVILPTNLHSITCNDKFTFFLEIFAI